jgi:hypothetical protein
MWWEFVNGLQEELVGWGVREWKEGQKSFQNLSAA